MLTLMSNASQLRARVVEHLKVLISPTASGMPRLSSQGSRSLRIRGEHELANSAAQLNSKEKGDKKDRPLGF